MITSQINEDLTQRFYHVRKRHRRTMIKANELPQEIKAYILKPISTQEPKSSTLPYDNLFVWKLMPSTPVGRAINAARYRLTESGIQTSIHDAYVILAHVMQQERSWIFANYDYKLDEQQASLYIKLIARRAANESLNDLLSS